jgi:hypothetical protein
MTARSLFGAWLIAVAVLWFLYPPAAAWVAERVPYAHLLLVPAAPTLPILTIAAGSGLLLARAGRVSHKGFWLVASVVIAGLAAWWMAIWLFWAFVVMRGGL